MNKQKCTHLDKTSECAVCGAEFLLVPVKEEVGENEQICLTCGRPKRIGHIKDVCYCPTPPLEVKEGWEKEFDKRFDSVEYMDSENGYEVEAYRDIKTFIKSLISQTIQETEAKIKMELIQKIKDSRLHLGYKNNILELLDK